MTIGARFAPTAVLRPPAAVLVALAFVLVALAGTAVPAAGQAGGPVARPAMDATRITEGGSIDIDGALDDDAWRLATPITDFRQQEPAEGGVPSEPTEIRVPLR